METTELKKFAQFARRSLLEQVSSKLKLVLADESAARREHATAVQKLEEAIQKTGEQQVIERVAYIWFNRFCALRFMDVNRYTRIGVVSPAEGQFQPEILAEAKMGYIDEEMVSDKIRQQVFALLDGKAPSRDPQGEAYRLLVVAACNYWNKAMPFLFERIDDYTELLMPDDLLSGNSILAHTREAMTPEVCGVISNQPSVVSKKTENCTLKTDNSAAGGVEVIGWLYQFYISEKKDEVFEGLKKNKKITPENIPAATQLFTPHWIVRYLVENSLGRLWMLNRPDSKLVDRMAYYIRPDTEVVSSQPSVISEKNSGSAVTENYIPEMDYLRVSSPEEIRICDPACGSGHMLTYAFDLLYAIYEEEGYEPAEIPTLILTHNLYGIEIDERAGELAAFALTMKARSRSRRFFRRPVVPNICVLENVIFEDGELAAVVSNQLSAISKETQSAFMSDMQAFEEADNFGSLIRPTMTLEQIAEVEKIVTDNCEQNTDLFEGATLKKVLQALRQADYLSPKYHVVVANPPYMGSKGMNNRLGKWAKKNYPNSKSDLFAMFIERNLDLVQKQGSVAMITMQSWMFLSSFEKLRSRLLAQDTILSMAHLGARAFDSIGGEVVSTTAFVLDNQNRLEYKGDYLRLIDGNSEVEKEAAVREAIKNPNCGWFYRASANDFNKIPGSPIAYWASRKTIELFMGNTVRSEGEIRQGLLTSDNDRFLRRWFEVSNKNTGFGYTRDEASKSGLKWFPINKGGDYRRWYGNLEYVVIWKNDGEELHNTVVNKYPYLKGNSGLVLKKTNPYFEPAITWTDISSVYFGARYMPSGMLYEKGGSCAYNSDLKLLLGYFCSKLSTHFLSLISPTLHYQVGDVGNLPYKNINEGYVIRKIHGLIDAILQHCISDWNSYETSWDFKLLPLLSGEWTEGSGAQNKLSSPLYLLPTSLSEAYAKLRAHWREMTLEMQQLEEENNRIFIEAYGLQDELTPEVPLEEITLTCNPYYRYAKSNQPSVVSDQQEETDNCTLKTDNSFPTSPRLEALLLADTMKEFISYAVGCMFGRYSLEAPGLILANQGDTIEDYFRIVQEKRVRPEVVSNQPSVISKDTSSDAADNSAEGGTENCALKTDNSSSGFKPDEDNVIPILDGDWFTDDITERFYKFLRVTFGEDHFEENLQFIEKALNIKGKRNYSIRDYFLKEFYNDHVKRYKKRPIYWLFSSPKGSFNALIYMHRYRPDTVSVVLNDYLREFRAKLTSEKNRLEAVSISAGAKAGEKTKALKAIEKISKMITELEEYEREVLYPLATEQVEIDLDDGVKVNYKKFGKALKKIPGLS